MNKSKKIAERIFILCEILANGMPEYISDEIHILLIKNTFTIKKFFVSQRNENNFFVVVKDKINNTFFIELIN